jgi:predicted nucleic acid-binding protein
VNVVDSSAWLEYFANGPNAAFFAKALEDTRRLVVPTLCLFEVFKKIHQGRGENDALQAAASMKQGLVVDLDAPLALAAARLSIEHRLPLADSVVLAASRSFNATLWTQDSDFKAIPNVRYRPRKP